MVDVFVYGIDIPGKVNETVVPCIDGYTVYIDRNLPQNRRISALAHAVWHILRGDFEKPDAGEIEEECHEADAQQLWHNLQAVRISEAAVDCTEALREDPRP